MTVDRLGFRPLAEDDLELVAAWLAAPHVRAWWRAPADIESVRAKYLPRIRGDEPTEVFVASLDGEPIGIIQRYRFLDHGSWAATIAETDVALPGAAGIDYLVGDASRIGVGVGTAMIDRFSEQLFADLPEIDVIVVTPQADNRASCGALARAGYEEVWRGRLDSDDPSDAGTSAIYVRRRPRYLTERLELRPLRMDDVDLLLDLDGDPEVMRYLTGGRPSTRDEVAEVVASAVGHRWIALDRATGAFVGWFALWPTGAGELELGYRLRREAWGRGLASEGARALLDLAFGSWRVERVWAQTMAVNERSRRVLERCGLRYHRIVHLEWDDPIPGTEHGEVEYELRRAEWEERTSPHEPSCE